jgi:hypothetical protein
MANPTPKQRLLLIVASVAIVAWIAILIGLAVAS